MIRVKATREGLVGQDTASGWKIDTDLPFVSLPSVKALRRFIRVSNPLNGKECIAAVMDVGPWNTEDDAYVFQYATATDAPAIPGAGIRPLAEHGVSKSMKGTNNSGIDLGEKVWTVLEMHDNTDVDWYFLT